MEKSDMAESRPAENTNKSAETPSASGRKRIVVLYGGRADEHPISCISTGSVLREWDQEKFEAVPIGITKEGSGSSTGWTPVSGSLALSCRK